MRDDEKTKAQLIEELRSLRERVGQGDAPTSAAAGEHLLADAEAVAAAARRPLLVVDSSLQVLCASTAYHQMFDTSRESVQRAPLAELGDGQWDIPRLRDQLEGLLHEDQTFTDFEVEPTVPNRGQRALLLSALRIRRGRDGPPVALLLLEDVTNHKHMEERLHRSEKLAAIGRLAGGIAHELRNPLGAIKNASYFLNMAIESPVPEVQETLDILDREVATCERIIGSLLDFTRTRPPNRRETALNDLVREALSRLDAPENVEIADRLDESLPPISADPDQLLQAIQNILSNAVQAMPDGGRLEVSSDHDEAGLVRVHVTDTGGGIPQEAQAKLFEPLYTTRAKGIGLGLAVTKALVGAHRGTIEVESQSGRGTTFTVRLPVGTREDH